MNKNPESAYDDERLVSIYDKMQMLDEQQDDKMFELRQENIRLRGQITYLQEELSMIEDQKDKEVDRLEQIIATLEEQLGDALYGR